MPHDMKLSDTIKTRQKNAAHAPYRGEHMQHFKYMTAVDVGILLDSRLSWEADNYLSKVDFTVTECTMPQVYCYPPSISVIKGRKIHSLIEF
jgi:hypothetical protein